MLAQGVKAGRAEERAALRGRIEKVLYDETGGYEPGFYAGLEMARDFLDVDPSDSEPSLTVAAIAVHLTEQIAAYAERWGRPGPAALVDTLTWVEARQ